MAPRQHALVAIFHRLMHGASAPVNDRYPIVRSSLRRFADRQRSNWLPNSSTNIHQRLHKPAAPSPAAGSLTSGRHRPSECHPHPHRDIAPHQRRGGLDERGVRVGQPVRQVVALQVHLPRRSIRLPAVAHA